MSALPVDAVSTGVAPEDGPFRVMVVDDSAVIRGMVSRWIEADPALTVVGSASNGRMAVQQLDRLDPEIVVLDIEMPELDGLSALPQILAALPDVKVIMASTLTLRNADISMKALAAGAADYIPKPSSAREMQGTSEFQRDLLAKIKALGNARRLHPGARARKPKLSRAELPAKPRGRVPLCGKGPIVLRPASKQPPRVLTIGSSTGGPQALFRLFGFLKNRVRLPILITQHMPATFTTILAEHLKRIAGAPCREAVNGEPVVAGTIYIAPGDWHMTVESDANQRLIRLNQAPPENFCRPAVDPMLRSLARAYGPNVLSLILTGMGHDGLNGGRAVAEAGGTVMAQDEATSVVWGMPGAVATGGLCSAVLPIDEIGPTLERMTSGSQP